MQRAGKQRPEVAGTLPDRRWRNSDNTTTVPVTSIMEVGRAHVAGLRTTM